MKVEFTTRHMFPEQKLFHFKVKVPREVNGQERLDVQEVPFEQGYFSTADRELVRAIMGSNNFKRSYIKLVTDESLVGEFLAGHTPTKIKAAEVKKLSDECARKLGRYYKINSDHIEMIRAQIVGRIIDDHAEVIIGDDLGIETTAHKKLKQEAKTRVRQEAVDPDKLQSAQRTSVFQLADKKGKTKKVESEQVDPEKTLKRTRTEDPDAATYQADEGAKKPKKSK